MILDKGFYADGKGGQTTACSFDFENERILIKWTGIEPKEVEWKIKDLSSTEPSGTSILITHRNASSLMASGPLAYKIHQSHQNYLDEKRQRQGILSKQSVLLITGISAAVLIAALLLYIYVLPWAAEKAVLLVPVETEIALGEKITEGMTGESITNDSVNLYLEEFVKQLNLDKTYPIKVRLIVSDEINAFALPGGNIFIYSGLLEKIESPEELVALIGHEVTHVMKRHSLKSMSRSLASGILFSLLLGDASGIASQADQFKQLDYSRALETEADSEGLRMMIENRVDPEGMLRLLQILKRENEQTPQLMKYLSTHPDTEERIRSVEENPESKHKFEKDTVLHSIFTQLKSSME